MNACLQKIERSGDIYEYSDEDQDMVEDFYAQ